MKQFLIVNTYCNTLYIKTLYTATFQFNLQYDETQVALVIYPRCISIVSSQQTKLCDKSGTALAKTCSKAW